MSAGPVPGEGLPDPNRVLGMLGLRLSGTAAGACAGGILGVGLAAVTSPGDQQQWWWLLVAGLFAAGLLLAMIRVRRSLRRLAQAPPVDLTAPGGPVVSAHAVAVSLTCPSCGAQVPTGRVDCPVCGHRIEAGGTP